MLKGAVVLLTAAIIAATPSLLTPSATAADPKCKNKANQYVACTNKLKAKAAPKVKGEKGAGIKDLKAEEHKTKVDDQ
jgi:hypothetical protein